MAQVLIRGTAWERSLEDYAYAAGLDRPGWAWEFLRRNESYQKDWEAHKFQVPISRMYRTGVTYCHLRESCCVAKRWGLVLLVNPVEMASESSVHWHSEFIARQVFCIAKSAGDPKTSTENLLHCNGRRHVLLCNGIEHLVIQQGVISARLAVRGRSLLKGDCQLTYQIEGLERLSLVSETLSNLRRLKSKLPAPKTMIGQTELRLRECLVALDGHLEGRTYRDIAEVLYGSERVKEVWTNETRHLKDKVRRAVAAGIEYMNGGYLKLLQ